MIKTDDIVVNFGLGFDRKHTLTEHRGARGFSGPHLASSGAQPSNDDSLVFDDVTLHLCNLMIVIHKQHKKVHLMHVMNREDTLQSFCKMYCTGRCFKGRHTTICLEYTRF
jgi:hypothetical protein